MIILRLLSVLTILALPMAAHAESSRFLRYPNHSNDGKLAFSYHGDIWVADSDGSNPRRLTAHVARDTTPRFSPDGQQIAFVSDRMGSQDVWVIPTAGGQPRQVTFMSTSDSLQYWTPDGEAVIFATTRGANPWGTPLYRAPIDGSMPTPYGMDRGAAGMVRQDGKMIAFNRTGFRYWRKHYRGNNNTDIWVQELPDGEIKQLTDTDVKAFREHTQDAHPMWGADGWIYFLSERDDIFNLWRISPEGGEPQQVTSHRGDGIQYPSISPDGTTIVYENDFSLWKYVIDSDGPQRIEVDLSFDPKDNLIEVVEVENNASSFSPSADGSQVAIGYRGELFLVPADQEMGEMTRVTDSIWRDRYQLFSPDGKTLAYISDRSGDEEIWLYDVASGEHKQLTTHESTKRSMRWSPDSSRILFEASNTLFLADAASGEVEELAHNPEGGYNLGDFSADGKWLCYSRSNSDLNNEVYLFDLENRAEHNVTRSRFLEFGGEISADGKHVAFISDRTGELQLYVVSLAKLTFDPDDPVTKQRRKNESSQPKPDSSESSDDEDSAADSDDSEGADESDSDEADDWEMDLDGIEFRARAVTSGSESVRTLFASPDRKRLFYIQNNELHSVGFDGEGDRKLGEGGFSSAQITGDGKKIFFSRSGGIHWMSASGGSSKQVEFELTFLVDLQAEWEQIFEEAWRVMKYRFYDENMHGYDWDAIKARYKPMLKYVGENQDLYDLCNEMIGELNASHTGVSGPPTRSMESIYQTRHLGFEMEADGEYYRVTSIVPHGPADREWLDISVGDYVLELEGVKLHAGDNYFHQLNHLLNNYADLKIASPGQSDDGDTQVLGEARDIRINTTSSVRNLLYESWVENNRKLVDEWSGGKVGYVHIRSMNGSSLERFETEINQFWNKNGMIIDIRYNGGGNIDQQLIDIIERRPYEYWNSRTGGRARGRRPRQAIAGPKVMLINWRSASDSEVTPQAFRDLELGRIVGNPTYGAVIATGSYSLINGARIRTPGSLVVTYDPSQPNNYGINLENFGVAPDVWVENTPADELEGFDRELKAAVDEALKMLAEGDWQYGEDDPKE